ncbi:hypothetical protein [Streptomyces roseoverticillatus]|uniref:DUF3077 domain-containing protein n=1 Tax=Streptomyces roseoverticillatus TaxID=66429 RepID=A0ABV3IYK4_9ACTN
MTSNVSGRDPRPEADASRPGWRLLPWSSPDDKPCFLNTSDSQGMLSQYADSVEEAQMAIGADVLADAGKLLANPEASGDHLRVALQDTAESLADILRVAESRGRRLPAPTRLQQ